MAPAHHTPTLESVPVTLSQHNAGTSGKIIRYAMIFEILANTVGIAAPLYYAKQLPALFAAPRPANTMVARLLAQANLPPPVTDFTVELFVGFVFTLTVAVALCLPNTKRAVESRPTVYALLLVEELVLIAHFALEGTTGRNGLNPQRCWQAIANLAPFALWRIWVLVVKPEWFGSYREAGVKKA